MAKTCFSHPPVPAEGLPVSKPAALERLTRNWSSTFPLCNFALRSRDSIMGLRRPANMICFQAGIGCPSFRFRLANSWRWTLPVQPNRMPHTSWPCIVFCSMGW